MDQIQSIYCSNVGHRLNSLCNLLMPCRNLEKEISLIHRQKGLREMVSVVICPLKSKFCIQLYDILCIFHDMMTARKLLEVLLKWNVNLKLKSECAKSFQKVIFHFVFAFHFNWWNFGCFKSANISTFVSVISILSF